MGRAADRAVILFDEDCGFCRWSLDKLLAWDRRGLLRPVALQDPEAERLLPGMDEERKMRSWHLVTGDGRVYSAGAAVPQLMDRLPAGAPIASLARAMPTLTERAYELVSRHRDKLAGLIGRKACAVDPRARDHTA